MLLFDITIFLPFAVKWLFDISNFVLPTATHREQGKTSGKTCQNGGSRSRQSIEDSRGGGFPLLLAVLWVQVCLRLGEGKFKPFVISMRVTPQKTSCVIPWIEDNSFRYLTIALLQQQLTHQQHRQSPLDRYRILNELYVL